MINDIAIAKACAVEDVFFVRCLFIVVCVVFCLFEKILTQKNPSVLEGFFSKKNDFGEVI
ncbi:hypothetical protein [Pedobacter soli]|uniref:Uncharacterized protein n=1 Tax=Pedobacter soli TaxID=390242 RepID=A0A1G6NJF8_9SPHI|nr:hypothetical protein [Pedobacter soli]SDC67417.1 hypothetical protein SAMN04488024_102684 [Pedobacter soli]